MSKRKLGRDEVERLLRESTEELSPRPLMRLLGDFANSQILDAALEYAQNMIEAQTAPKRWMRARDDMGDSRTAVGSDPNARGKIQHVRRFRN